MVFWKRVFVTSFLLLPVKPPWSRIWFWLSSKMKRRGEVTEERQRPGPRGAAGGRGEMCWAGETWGAEFPAPSPGPGHLTTREGRRAAQSQAAWVYAKPRPQSC